MSPDPMRLIDTVGEFLSGPILAAVPAAMQSDVRAAVKGLRDAARELDVLYPLLLEECDALAALCRDAGQRFGVSGVVNSVAVLAEHKAKPALGLGELMAVHGALQASVGDVALALQRDERPDARILLDEIYTVLGAQARKRMAWQSVFVQDKVLSDMLRETWPAEKK